MISEKPSKWKVEMEKIFAYPKIEVLWKEKGNHSKCKVQIKMLQVCESICSWLNLVSDKYVDVIPCFRFRIFWFYYYFTDLSMKIVKDQGILLILGLSIAVAIKRQCIGALSPSLRHAVLCEFFTSSFCEGKLTKVIIIKTVRILILCRTFVKQLLMIGASQSHFTNSETSYGLQAPPLRIEVEVSSTETCSWAPGSLTKWLSAKVGLGVPVFGTLNTKAGREPSAFYISSPWLSLFSLIYCCIRVLQRDRPRGWIDR